MIFQLFDRVRQSGKLTKVQVIPANFKAADIISSSDETMIIDIVNIVFHCAASVTFKQTLQNAVEVNIILTQKIVQLVKQLKNCKAFVHVSTLFSNSFKQECNEVIYDLPLTYKDVIAIAEISDKVEGDKSTSVVFQHNFPNVYCLTKHYGEKLVCDQACQLPIAIFRPPIIGPSYKNLPGWTDNCLALSGFFVTLLKGYTHTYIGRENNPSNNAPVDYCVNALIAAAWDVSEKFAFKENFSIPIYNYMFKENNLSIKKQMEYIKESFHAPLEGSVYYYSYVQTSSIPIFHVLFFLFTTLPAAFADIAAISLGKKTKFLKLSKTLKLMILVCAPFMSNKFQIGNENVKNLLKKAKENGCLRDDFNFDFECIDWRVYYQNFQSGIKQYYFKEDMSKCKELARSYQR
jgi:alcohol-forming fatty acyl-CoA reductase